MNDLIRAVRILAESAGGTSDPLYLEVPSHLLESATDLAAELDIALNGDPEIIARELARQEKEGT